MKIAWTTKIGNEAKPLRIGLTQDGALVSFGTLTGPGGSGAPQIRMRLRQDPAATVLSFDLVVYADPSVPATLNAQHFFTNAEFATITPGIYAVEVDAYVAARDVTFPDDRYILVRFLASVD